MSTNINLQGGKRLTISVQHFNANPLEFWTIKLCIDRDEGVDEVNIFCDTAPNIAPCVIDLRKAVEVEV